MFGRILFSAIFIRSGVQHFTRVAMMAAYASAKGVRATKFTVPLAGAMIFLDGISVLLGAYARIGAALLILLASFVIFLIIYLGFALVQNVPLIAALFAFCGTYQGIFRSVGKTSAHIISLRLFSPFPASVNTSLVPGINYSFILSVDSC